MKIRKLAALFVSSLIAGCSPSAEAPQAASPVCRVAQPPLSLPLDLSEISGVAISRTEPGLLWSHTDSGTEPRLFAIDAEGNLRATIPIRIQGGAADDLDWEDIAAAPCAGGECLFIGDIGDNEAVRPEILIHRLREPSAGEVGPLDVETFRVRYPDGPRDAEALFVLPSGRLFIITKGVESPVSVFEYPGALDASRTVELARVRDLTAAAPRLGDWVTGASSSADGSWVAVRTHVAALVYQTADLLGEGEIEPVVVVDLKPLGEAQGEGVALGPQGSIVLTSEGGSPGIPGTLGIVWCEVIDD